MEEGGERWSKPHVSTLSLHSLFELRTCLQTGTVLLDLDGYSLPQIIGRSLWVPVVSDGFFPHVLKFWEQIEMHLLAACKYKQSCMGISKKRS